VQDLEDMLLTASYLMNWNYAFHWVPGGFLDHTWSLATEEQFYLIWPFALMFLVRRRRAAFFIILSAITTEICWRLYLVHCGASDGRTYAGFDTHSDTLLIGCAVAFAPMGQNAKAWAQKLVLLPIGMFFIICFRFHIWTSYTQCFGFTLAGLCAAWIMVAAMQPGLLKRLLSTGFLVYTGRISYGWYLWSYPIFLLGTHLFPKYYEKPLPVILSYVAAMMSFHFIERPFLRLKGRFEPSGTALYPSALLAESAVGLAP
jgi:peptidoglycan/LPS O-acetylase OafA/YrhL